MGAERTQSNEAWKNRYLKRLNTITVIIIIVFSILHIGIFAIKGAWAVGKGLAGGFLGLFGFNSGRAAAVSSGVDDMNSFDTIEGTLSFGDLSIVYGNDYSVAMENFTDKTMPTVEVKNGTLKIKQKDNSFDFFGNNLPNDAKVVITVPEGIATKLDLKLNMGSITLKDIDFGDVKLDADMGSIKITNCEMQDLDLSADMGAITLSECSFTKGNINANMGGIDVVLCSFDTLDTDADMGGITVSGSFDELTADCDMGGITVQNDRQGAKYDLDADMGSVKLNGVDQGDKYKN